MPAQLEILLAGRTDRQIGEFHDESITAIVCVSLTYQLFDNVAGGVSEKENSAKAFHTRINGCN